MTFKEAIYDIREALKLLSIDSDFTDRRIIFLMNMYRSTIIRQFITNYPGESRHMFTQSLYMELELIDESRFPDKYLTGFTVLSSKLTLPKTVGYQMYKDLEIRTVGITGTEVEVVNKTRATQVKYAPKGFIYAFVDNDDKLYFVSSNTQYKNLSQVIVTCILEDPQQESVINNTDLELTTYPVSLNTWETIKGMVVAEIARTMGVPVDVLNNKRDEQLTEKPQE